VIVSGRMSMPLDTIAMIGTITEVPSGVIPGFAVVNIVGGRVGGGGRLEVP
jgi:hypothetical protein